MKIELTLQQPDEIAKLRYKYGELFTEIVRKVRVFSIEMKHRLSRTLIEKIISTFEKSG